MPCTASSFIKELPAEWIEHRDFAQIMNMPVSAESVKSRFEALKAMLAKK